MSISQDYERFNFSIKIENLHKRFKELENTIYFDTIEFKFNGQQIPHFDLLRFVLPTKDNLIKLKKYPIELKINGYYYEVLKEVFEK